MAPKKEKAQKMQLGEFLTDTSLGSWADEMEDAPMPSPAGGSVYGRGDRGYGQGGGFGASKFEDRGPPRTDLPLPSKPPYTVHLGNLSYDATEGDISDFFNECAVESVRIVEDRLDSKPKGFGYVEFKTLDGLKKALSLNETQFQGRRIRISVAEPQKDRLESTRDFSDWSRKGPLPDMPNQRKPSGRDFGAGAPRGAGFDNMSDAGGERGGRRAFEPSDGKVRDFGNWERKGPPTPTLTAGQPSRSFDRPGSRDGQSLRRNSPAWGEGRSQDGGSRPPRREFTERPPIDRAPTAAEQDNQWRSKMRPDAPPAPPTPDSAAAKSPALSTRQLSNSSSPAAAPVAPVERPRLNLLKRGESSLPADTVKASEGDAKANPFGAAKPIDTATREKEVEEKRQVALQEKKEADEKAREEKNWLKKRQKKKNAWLVTLNWQLGLEGSPKSPQQQNGNTRPNTERKTSQVPERKKLERKSTGEKENGLPAPSAGKQYEILRRQVDEEATAADEEREDAEAIEENANGIITGDKETKPQEIVRDPKQDAQTNGGTSAAPDQTAKQLEDEGWSTVSKPEKKRKNAVLTVKKHGELDRISIAVHLFLDTVLSSAELNAPQGVITCGTRKNKTIAAGGKLPECIPMTIDQFALISSILTLGGLLGALAAGSYSSEYGRLRTMRLMTIALIVGPIAESLSPNIATLAIGRFISGLGAGSALVVVPIYISEICPPEKRGLFGAMTQILCNLGILISQTLGYFLSYGNMWRVILATAGCVAVVQFFCLTLVPESPQWLAEHGKPDGGKNLLRRLRGRHYDIRKEWKGWNIIHDDPASCKPLLRSSPLFTSRRLTACVDEEDSLIPPASITDSPVPPESITMIDTLRSPQYRPAVIAVIAVMLAQQFTGINSIIMYSVHLLTSLLPTSAALLTVAVSAINLIMTTACAPLPDRIGRKTCILASTAGMGISSILLAVGIGQGIKPLGAIATLLFVAAFAVGLGPVPFILANELVGPEAVGATQSWALAANWIATFVVSQFFPMVNKAMGEKGRVYYLFAGLAAVLGAFIAWWVPETRGRRDVDEVWGRNGKGRGRRGSGERMD
ncbi:uncharacterized protein KY384_004733 [Bacidia gigantensis]|uniref:uncharacterized protein n=1 Tax=Bacidia gigantensis TaxID=2732470 RepID=UPI001D050EF5|nr:uncharacterized protein KY384_004733 [Bacidia gigantensis]KAG8530233.1 hypothetical protein KY384_004733 [Bacidia gigantensis]